MEMRGDGIRQFSLGMAFAPAEVIADEVGGDRKKVGGGAAFGAVFSPGPVDPDKNLLREIGCGFVVARTAIEVAEDWLSPMIHELVQGVVVTVPEPEEEIPPGCRIRTVGVPGVSHHRGSLNPTSREQRARSVFPGIHHSAQYAAFFRG